MIVCISGWKQNGKDMLASYLIDNYGANRVSFADPLKDMVAEEYGIDRASLDDQDRKEKPLLNLPVKPTDDYSRMIAKFLAKEFRGSNGKIPEGFDLDTNQGIFGNLKDGIYTQDVCWTPRALAILKGSTNRSVRSNYWVQKAIEKAQNSERMVVISDLRYKSEMSQIKEAFGEKVLFLRVQRFETSPSSDPSERDLDDALFDAYIDNRSTKEIAFGQLEQVLNEKFGL